MILQDSSNPTSHPILNLRRKAESLQSILIFFLSIYFCGSSHKQRERFLSRLDSPLETHIFSWTLFCQSSVFWTEYLKGPCFVSLSPHRLHFDRITLQSFHHRKTEREIPFKVRFSTFGIHRFNFTLFLPILCFFSRVFQRSCFVIFFPVEVSFSRINSPKFSSLCFFPPHRITETC